MALGQARHIPAGFGHLRQHGACQGQQPLADGREAQRPDVFLNQGRPVMAFQRLQLMRQRGLGQKQPRGGLGQAAALREGQKVSICRNSRAVVAMSRIHPVYEDNEIES